MPREKKVLRYCAGIVDYDVTDTTHWAQMQGTVLVRCDHKAKEGGVGLVSQFNAETGHRASWYGKVPDNIDKELWLRDDHVEVYIMEKDIS